MPSGIKQVTTQSIAYDGNITNLKSKTTQIRNTYYNGNVRTYTQNPTTIKEDFIDKKTTITSPTAYIKETISYDPKTNLIAKYQLNNLNPINYEYDQKGRLTKQTDGKAQINFTYNNRGNIRTITDANGRTTTFEYDLLDRVTKTIYANGASDNYVYDAQGNITKYRAPGGSNANQSANKDFSFAYNGADHRTKFSQPSNKTTFYEYNKERKPIAINYADNSEVNYIYDRGELKTLQTKNSKGEIESTYNYSYSFYNNLSAIAKTENGASETTSYSKDGDLLTSINYGGLHINENISFAYGASGAGGLNPSSITYGGKTDAYSYDQDSLLTRSGSFSIYYTNGFVRQIYASPFNKQFTYDEFGLIKTISNSASSSFNETISVRDNNHRIVKRAESITGKSATDTYEYEYDAIGQLTKVIKNNKIVEEYEYDHNGNRIKSIINSVQKIAAYNQDDEIVTNGNESYEFDDRGTLRSKTIGDQKTEYKYGVLGELREVKLPDQTVIKYHYNANNFRAAKEINSTIAQKYLWLNNTTLLGFYDRDNNFARFTYTTDRTPNIMEYKGKTYSLFYDHLGSLRAIVNNGGRIVKQIEYDSFGNIASETNPSLTNTTLSYRDPSLDDLEIPFGFAGGLYDKHTNLIRFGYRDYDPNIGRWTAKDPIDFAAGQSNLYVYVGNDPINFVDPSGLETTGVWRLGKPTPRLSFGGLANAGCFLVGGVKSLWNLKKDVTYCNDQVYDARDRVAIDGQFFEICGTPSAAVCAIACFHSRFYERIENECLENFGVDIEERGKQ
ncbi:MAG: hypothetical protein LBU73_00385 [Helicobacteraceae bacterium]|jgi:RHS repeat-associated protein|nr:hypothetical protein [Helicobacteraceae bacterium]